MATKSSKRITAKRPLSYTLAIWLFLLLAVGAFAVFILAPVRYLVNGNIVNGTVKSINTHDQYIVVNDNGRDQRVGIVCHSGVRYRGPDLVDCGYKVGDDVSFILSSNGKDAQDTAGFFTMVSTGIVFIIVFGFLIKFFK